MLGVPVSTCDVFVRGELGMRTLASRRDELTMRMFGDLLSTHNSHRLVAKIVRHRLTQARTCMSAHRSSSPTPPIPPPPPLLPPLLRLQRLFPHLRFCVDQLAVLALLPPDLLLPLLALRLALAAGVWRCARSLSATVC